MPGGHHGIDHIFKNPVNNEYIIVESKFHGTGGLTSANPNTGLARQMSDAWIRGADPDVLNLSNRLFMALGEDVNLYNQVVNNYKRVVGYVQANGTINYKYVGSDGYEVNTVFNN